MTNKGTKLEFRELNKQFGDVTALADRLHEALSMSAEERAQRSSALTAAATARSADHWLGDQLAAAGFDI